MEQPMTERERISALADGRLQGAEFEQALRALQADADARQAWHEYHVVADVLRSRELAACALDARLIDGVRSRLAGERIEGRAQPVRAEAANDAAGGWKLVAGLASVAAFAAIGWNVLGSAWQPPAATVAEAQNVPVPPALQAAAPEAQAMIRDPRLDELLAAHRQSGGISALQMPAGFLRNATYEAPTR